MTISLGFVTFDINLLAVAIYLAVVYAGTRYLKPVADLHPVFLSWGLSVPAFFLVWLLARPALTVDLAAQFAILTLCLNGGLKVVHVAWDFLSRRFLFIPGRHREGDL
jgi:hypothetical protein